MPIQPGSRLGPYEIAASIGVGGMGEVWRAKDTRLDRDVAIKVLPAGLAQNGDFLERFDREAKAISQLNHPNVCTLFDVGHDEAVGVHYLVMELLEGESLADRIEKGPLPLHEVFRIGQQIASALDAAHRRQITHRDLKPGNIMLTKSGAKLLDFGLAKTTIVDPGPIGGLTSLPTDVKPLTTEGTILGTFQYMAPEQLEGLEADARTDIFGFGAVLYEMATGHRAFEGGSKTSLIAAIVASQPAPISSIVAMTPPALDHVVGRCLEKDPDDRWQSAHDVASELQWISEAGSQAGVAAPVTIRRKTRERLAWSLVAILGVSTVAASWLAGELERRVEDRPVLQTSVVAPDGVAFDVVGLASPPALSPDGKWIAFGGKDVDRDSHLYLRRLDGTQVFSIPGTQDPWYPFWSPDSQHIAFFDDGKLKRAPVVGGPTTTVCDVLNGRGGTWSDEGTIIIGVYEKGLYRVPSGGGELTLHTEPEEGSELRWPWMIPGADRFVYLEAIEGGESKIRAGALDGSLDIAIVESAANPAWAGGRLLYMVDRTLMTLQLDVDTFERVGESVALAEGVLVDSRFARSMFTVSNTGLLAYYTGVGNAKGIMTWFDLRGERLGTLGEAEFVGDIEISPDGKLIAVSVRDEMLGPHDIWIYEAARDVRTRLTFDPSDENQLAWATDGETLFFHRLGTGAMRRPVSGLSDAEALGGLPLLPTKAAPDGKTLVGASWVGHYDVGAYSLDQDDEPWTLLGTSFHEFPHDVSPDGRYLLYTSNESGINELYVTRFPEPRGKWQISVGGARSAKWSPDGQEIFYSQRDPTTRILSVPVGADPGDLGEPRVVLSVPDAPADYFDWALSPDGQRLLVTVSADPKGATRSPITLVTNWTGRLEN